MIYKLTGKRMLSGKRSFLMIPLAMLAFGCHKTNVGDKDLRDFSVVNLVANKSLYNPQTQVDPTLINGFGIAWSPTGIAWVNSVLGHVSELYDGDGHTVRKGVFVPNSPTDSLGFPCGVVFSGGKGFKFTDGTPNFIFSGFDGVISAWNGTSGGVAKFIAHPAGASYTGLAIGASNGSNYIYGANFGQKKIDVWDTAFRPVSMSFKDPGIPAGYSPYNIQAVGDYLFVVYGELATSGPAAGQGVAGAGKGYVSVFNTNGTLVRRFASKGSLNLPWGVVMAPGTFLSDHDMVEDGTDDHGGSGSNYGSGNSGSGHEGSDDHGHHDPKDPVVLVGNFGDGHISVFTQDGKYLGLLQSHKHPLVVDGLWALTFAPSTSTVDRSRLYFSAGPAGENDGVFGYIKKD